MAIASATTRVVYVEGNIGSGKSTLLAQLARRFADDPSVIVIPEPAEEWSAHGFLRAMYSDASARPAFQLTALVTLAGRLIQALARRPRLVIAERSIWSNYHVFAKASLRGDALSMYAYAWQELVTALACFSTETRFLWLKGTPASHARRIAARNRPEEATIDEGYLATLEALHASWLAGEQAPWTSIETNAARPLCEVVAEAEEALQT